MSPSRRNLTPEELAEYTEAANAVATAAAEAEALQTALKVRFNKLRALCGAHPGMTLDEETGEWLRPDQAAKIMADRKKVIEGAANGARA